MIYLCTFLYYVLCINVIILILILNMQIINILF